MARKRSVREGKGRHESDGKEEEADLVASTLWLTVANKKYLYGRKAEGKGTLSEQVNKILEMARVMGWE